MRARIAQDAGAPGPRARAASWRPKRSSATARICVGYRFDVGSELALFAQTDVDYLGFAAGLSDMGAARSPRAFFVPISFGVALGL